MKTWIRIAVRNLWKNRRRSCFTMGAIALGFAAMNTFGGYTAYMFRGLADAYIYAQGNGHLTVFKRGYLGAGNAHPSDHLMTPRELAAVETICSEDPSVVLVTPQLMLNGLLSNGRVSTVFIAVGRVPSDSRRIRSMALGFIGKIKGFDGRELDDGVPYGVGLAQGLADRLDLRLDSGAVAMATTVDGQMNALDAEVFQLFEASEAMRDTVMMVSLDFARRLYDTDGADRLTVLLQRDSETEAARRTLQRRMDAAGLDMEIKTWEELCPSYTKIRDMFNVIFLFVFIIVLIIVVLSIINTISMAVMERIREIGTLRALGLKRRGVIMMFSVESAVLALCGSAGGLVLTLAAWFAIRAFQPTWVPPLFTSRVPIEVDLVPRYLLISLVSLVVLSVVAAVLPARRAARMSIIDALGHV